VHKAGRREAMSRKNILKKFLAWLLIGAVLFQGVFVTGTIKSEAASKKLTLTQAQKLAIANSANYKKILNKIEIQEIKYATAVKSIKMKKKNMSTFRWTPLLSFKFPEKPTLADEYEWQYKPLQITCTITELKHQLNDDKLASKESVSLLYVETYICQEKIDFYNKSLEESQKNLKKNQARLVTGEATQSDIDKMQQKINKLTTELSLQMRTFETKKSALSKLINLNVTSGYTFDNPFVSADIPRNILDNLVDYTLENDEDYYETKMETSLALASLNMMERMMRNQYGKKMDSISPYIKQALNGDTIDSSAFKKTYNQMLEDIDKPWNGKKRILFVKIKKEWFKGAIDGSRYVEDDPYALYSGALEYADAVREQNSAKEELTQRVKDDFETLKTAQIAYTDAVKLCDDLENDLKKGTELNRLGNLTYDELSDIQDEYEEQELSTLELLSEYSKLLYSYDRLTCGGITAYLEGTDINMKAASGGNSYIADETNGKAYYYIEYAVEDNLFRLGVSIPDDYSIDITHFALYVDKTMVGDKTEISKVLEHLALDLDMADNVSIYLYNEDELIDVCDIDASVYQDTLDITGGYSIVHEDTLRTVANYSYELDTTTNMVAFAVTPKATENIAYYKLLDSQGTAVLGDDLVSVSDTFRYLSLLTGDLSQLQIAFYNSGKSLLYTGNFETATASIVVLQ
jgi:hypothetical protein